MGREVREEEKDENGEDVRIEERRDRERERVSEREEAARIKRSRGSADQLSASPSPAL